MKFNLATSCPELQCGEDGIFYATAGEVISYPEEGKGEKAENLKTTILEDASWFLHWNDCTRRLIRNFPLEGRGKS
jgi:hypothetical protein